MEKLFEAFKNLSSFKTLVREIRNDNFFHANLFVSEDAMTADNFVSLVSLALVCENGDACLECGNCRKVLASSMPDVEVFPKGARLLVSDSEKIVSQAFIAPMISNRKVFVLKDFSSATTQAQNKILKILEEPPKNVYFLLWTTNLEGVLPTVRSRSKIVQIERFDDETLLSLSKKLFGPLVSREVVLDSDGLVGNVQKFLMGGGFESLAKDAFDIVVSLKSSREVAKFSKALYSRKEELKQKLELIGSLYRDMFLVLLGQEKLVKNKQQVNVLKSLAKELSTDALVEIFGRIEKAKKELDANVNPQLVCDNLLLGILEEKYLCKQKQ